MKGRRLKRGDCKELNKRWLLDEVERGRKKCEVVAR